MKYLSLLFFAILLSCNVSKQKKATPKKEVVKTELKEKSVKTEKELPIATTDVMVILKNNLTTADAKKLITNSGLQWNPLTLDKINLKAGLVKIPTHKTDFWIERLKQSNEFKYVDLYSEKNINSIIKKENATFLKLSKTPCFGDCPVYTVTIDKKGNVTYNGIEFVLEKGVRKFQLTPNQFNSLKEKLNKKDFSSFNAKYDNPKLTDLPSTHIDYNGKQIEIRIWRNVPDELIAIHEHLEEILLKKKFFE